MRKYNRGVCWKKVTILLVSISMVAIALCSCGIFNQSLTVYVDAASPLFREAVVEFRKEHSDIKMKVVYFDSYEEMKEKMNSEVMAGKGPDVMLFDSVYDVDDSFKMSAAGSLLELDERIVELDEDAYFTPILDAGVINGHQYFLPLSWNILQAYSSQGMMGEKGYSDNMFIAYVEDAAALANDDTMGISSAQYGRMDGSLMNYFLDVAGVELIDWRTGNLNENKERVQQVAEFVKVVSDNQEKNTEIAKRYSSDFAGVVAHFTYLSEDFPFMNNMRFYQTVYPRDLNDEMYFVPYKNLDDGITAQIVQYGAINAYTKYENEAWNLLRYILDYTCSVDFNKYVSEDLVYASVNKAVYAAHIEELATTESEKGQHIYPLEDEWVKVLEEIPTEVNSAVIPNGAMGSLIQVCMEPYFNEEDSFDNCYSTLVTRLQMYLDE